MLECNAKHNSIFEKLNTIAVSLIFWVIATLLIPIVSLVFRLYSKESKINELKMLSAARFTTRTMMEQSKQFSRLARSSPSQVLPNFTCYIKRIFFSNT